MTHSQTILIGDAREQLRLLAPQSVHCIVSSPPYWGLRDYGIPPVLWGDGWEGVFGNEPTIEQYVTHTLELFTHLERVLRDDGVIWWNLGDTYADDSKWGGTTGGKHVNGLHGAPVGRLKSASGLPAGNKCLIPYRVAIALQEAGWVVRSDVQWIKPSPMPESINGVRWERCRVKAKGTGWTTETHPAYVHGDQTKSRSVAFGSHGGTKPRDDAAQWIDCPGCLKCEPNGGYVLRQGRWRPTSAHEPIFLITKPGNYCGHAQQVAEQVTGNAHSRGGVVNPKCVERPIGVERQNGLYAAAVAGLVQTRNPRSTWRISPESYKGAHFATFPSELVYRCLKASTSDRGCCPACGAQWVAVVEKGRIPTRPGTDSKVNRASARDDSPDEQQNGTIVGNRDPQRHIAVCNTVDYRPTCSCSASSIDWKPLPPVPCVVLDPFVGSGTTLQVCAWTARKGIGIDLGEQHRPLIEERIATKPVCLVRREKAAGQRPRPRKKRRERLLFE